MGAMKATLPIFGLVRGQGAVQIRRPDRMPSKTSSRSNSFLLIDTTGTAHPPGSSNPGQCHVNFAEGCHLFCHGPLDGQSL
jgi:hypothetical protein